MDDTMGPCGPPKGIALLACLAVALVVALPAFASTEIHFEDLSSADSVPWDTVKLRVAGVPLVTARSPEDAVLNLRSIRAFAQDARITIQTSGGEIVRPAPAHRYFAGDIEGRPGSTAVLRFNASGEVHGYVLDGNSWWRIGEASDPGRGSRRARVYVLDSGSGEPFDCANGDLPGDLDSLRAEVAAQQHDSTLQAAESERGAAVSYTARIAFETDQEYLAQFGGDTDAAVDYIGDLVALGSTIFSEEVGTSWIASSVNLWDTSDPWDESPGSCALYEFGKYWNDNNDGIERTIAHMLSGKSRNSGVAWIGVLCAHNFSSFGITTSGCVEVPANITGSEYGGAYGFTGGIDGNFDINDPAPIWDSFGILHEIGHNFDSPHTHCYEGYGGVSDAIDMCYGSESGGSCHSGSTSLPSGCPGPGNGCGTIMSYCHLLGGGLGGNISLVLGEDWPYGVEPERVPGRMASHVAARAALNPSCLAPVSSDDPDLIVESPAMNDTSLTPSQAFEASATVRNDGSGAAAATTLRYYWSNDPAIETSDTELGIDEVASLAAGETSAEEQIVVGPEDTGTHWFGACVDSVSREADTANNCSNGIAFTVREECGEGCMIFSNDFEGAE